VLTLCYVVGVLVREQQQPVELGAARAVQELSRLHAAEDSHHRRLHVVEDDRLAAGVEVLDQRFYALYSAHALKIKSSYYTLFHVLEIRGKIYRCYNAMQ
jgi:hypothetical protein